MTQDKHTPGPWKTCGPSSFGVISDTPAGRFLVGVAHHGPDQTALDTREISTEQARANARLFAAAPNLLEALEALVGAADYLGPGSHMSVNHSNFDKARAAIAKARGQA